MSMVIFFGGLVMGFIIGWVSMVLLTMATVKNQEGLIYCRVNPGPEEDLKNLP